MRVRSYMLSLLATTSLMGAATPVLAADAAADKGNALEELVVTANRREQKLIDVPVSVVAVSGSAIKNANLASITELTQLAAGLTYNTNFGGGFLIRGVGTQSVLITSEQSVSVVVDDVVQGLPEISFAGPSYQALTDIERAEVLRGPQGTLFGKNSSAGVVQIITKKPKIGEFSGNASTSYGTGNEIRVTGDLNIPIVSTLAVRVSAFEYRRDGYIHNLFTHNDIGAYNNRGLRAKLLWQPTERAEVYLIASHSEGMDTGNGIWTLRSCGSGFQGVIAKTLPCAVTAPYGVVAGPKNLSGAWDGLIGVKTFNNSLSGRINYDLGGGATLKLITAGYKLKTNEQLEVDSTPLRTLSTNVTQIRQRQFSQEARIEGTKGPLDYSVGAFYYSSHAGNIGLKAGTFNSVPDNSAINFTNAFGPVSCCVSIQDASTRSEAVFGQLTFHAFEDKLQITGGLRYTNDKVTMSSVAYDFGGICGVGALANLAVCKAPGIFPSTPAIARENANDLSGRITVQYSVMQDVNVYATYSRGYKGPLIAYATGKPLLPVDPEKVKNIEAGIKGAFLDNSLILTADVFHAKYTDFQGQTTVVDPNNAAIRSLITTNAGGLKTSGLEVEATFRATPELTIRGAYAHVPTKFTEFAIQCQDNFTNPATTPGQCTYRSPKAPLVNQFNARGYPLIFSPKNTFNVGLNYEKEIMGDEMVSVSMNYNWRSKTYTVPGDPNSINPAYGLLGANIGFGPANRQWRASLWARNLLDKYYVTGIFKTPLDSGSATSTPISTIGYSNIPSIDSSRTVGAKLEVNF